MQPSDDEQVIDFDEAMAMDVTAAIDGIENATWEETDGLGGRQVSATTQHSSSDGSTVGSARSLTGRLPLRLYLTCDDKSFSKYQVLVRQHIEFFESREEDLGVVQGRNKAVVLGQGKVVLND